jgi:hypothetical protein
MNYHYRFLGLSALTVLILMGLAAWLNTAEAANLQLSWIDNASNETGFIIERKTGTSGTFAQIATVGANVNLYTDTGLTTGSIYCYRVQAYNSAGVSAYTPQGCGTASVTAPAFDFSLTQSGNKSVTQGQSTSNSVTATLVSGSAQSVSLSTSGFPSGTTASFVTSNSCSPTCSRTLNIATSASTPAGTYPITVTGTGAGVTKTTNFSLTVNPNATSGNYTLSVNVVKTLTNGGSANGTVTSQPSGINCGTDCAQIYASGTSVKLSAVSAAGSSFAGWSGHQDCTDGSVTMTTNISCTATFNPLAIGLTVTKSGTGSGTVTSSPSGISCGSDCSQPFASGASVKLTATAASGSVFKGWSGGNCGGTASCTVVVNGNTSVNAVFDTSLGVATTDKIGVYRPSTGDFFLDGNGNGAWEGCSIDICMKWLAQHSGIPVAGDWDGTGTTRIGTFNSANGAWYLDRNGNGRWDGCTVDICITSFGEPEDFPLVRSNGANRPSIGIYRASGGVWKFDANGNNVLNSCQIDNCYSDFGSKTQLGVVGDWDGDGKGQIAVFAIEQGSWAIDTGNGKWDKCAVDKCYSGFGQAQDLPVAGDWDGNGKAKIGVFRPSTGQWFLDKNGNGRHDSCGIDTCVSAFGLPDDLPVVGKWLGVGSP